MRGGLWGPRVGEEKGTGGKSVVKCQVVHIAYTDSLVVWSSVKKPEFRYADS